MPECNSRIDSDWQFVEKILDLTDGHSNALRARMIVDVLGKLRQQRRAPVASNWTDPDGPLAAWLLALGKPLPDVTR